MSGRYVTAQAARQIMTCLNERDWHVIERVAGLHFVTGAQLNRLFFAMTDDLAASGRTSRRTLLRLVRLGVLERLPRRVGGVRAGSAGYVYRLGVAGHRLAALRGWQPERQRRHSQLPGLAFLDHTLLIAELHTRLCECARRDRIELLTLEPEPSCHRVYDGDQGQRLTLKPDSFVRLGVGPYEDSYFIEVDRGTEGWRTIVRQLRSYIAYYATGHEQTAHGVFPKVLWLTTSAERAVAIRGCIEQIGDDARLFAAACFDTALSVMAPSKSGCECMT